MDDRTYKPEPSPPPRKAVTVSDGLSTTVMIGERPPRELLNPSAWALDTDNTQQRVTQTGGNRYFSTDGLTPSSPCPSTAVFGPGSITNRCSFNAVWSHHSGGANFVFGDGSVQFLTYAVTANLGSSATFSILDALASAMGGETIPSY